MRKHTVDEMLHAVDQVLNAVDEILAAVDQVLNAVDEILAAIDQILNNEDKGSGERQPQESYWSFPIYSDLSTSVNR
ncbi:hypothetical protein [Anoxynatronum buryatiense]|uniref:Uncharacterized protein n=1 Tax=Anoxynatronum buryatiense TaxID=489973 RepID=A0AA45WZD4_9CLOT|nr:hypothetical protein [Anoxynatronum buryatiense]SMP71690.1 hypothetical protein SAMN06296020_12420 [Anoxynatronum buryatiense]